jgi:hypothetical protein
VLLIVYPQCSTGHDEQRIDAVDLKHVLRDIQTDCGNLHVDGSLMHDHCVIGRAYLRR